MSSEAAPGRKVSVAGAEPVIAVRNVVKEYRLGALEGLRTLGRRMLGGKVPERQRFRALDDVSFTVRRGEVVGIIGHNGAGKSTLLKLLCNITQPTSGSVKVQGRISPLIEVGAGLIGDMTGRENIYLNASILGLSRKQIESKVDGIIEFAELDKFIDTPVKRYSSGMKVRLGYSIATALEAEVLIVDEVLAVGDLQFQRKSIERMQRLIRDSNRTVLIVGHNVRQLERVCSRVLMLDHGRVIADGKPAEVTGLYFERIQQTQIANDRAMRTSPSQRQWVVETSGEVDVIDVQLLDEYGAATTAVEFASPLEVRIDVESTKDFSRVDFGVALQTLDHLPVAISSLTSSLEVPLPMKRGENRFVCRFEEMRLLPGAYSLRVAIKDDWGQQVWAANNVAPFLVVAPPSTNRARFSDYAFVQFPASWHRESVVYEE